MMFGHNDEHRHEDAEPKPDETLAGNQMPAATPSDQSMSDVAQPGAPAMHGASDASDTAGDYIMTDTPGAGTVSPSTKTMGDVSGPAASDDDLMGIKQQALQQLSPLVSHLDQSPEEEFRTIMMLIQAADNKKLIPEAYRAAQAITDEKAKAQALLDVVNEINYFTQQEQHQSEA